MIRVVFDTNVLVSSLIKKGKPNKLFRKVLNKELKLIISEKLLSELSEVCQRNKIKRYVNDEKIRDFLSVLTGICEIIDVKSNFKVITEDPDDDVVLNSAYDGKVDYIVSGDEHLLALKEFKGIKIVSVSKMLEMLK